MPFTFAHPLYAAPLKLVRPAWFSLTGLVLGSMSPDFEYFIALEPYQSIGHTGAGLLLHALPLSLLLALLFHHIVKEPLALHLPGFRGLDLRAAALAERHAWRLKGAREWLVFALSVAIGFYLHVLLDAFTHESGYFVRRLGMLRLEWQGFPVYKLLQHSLSLIGLTAQGAIVLYVLSRVKPHPRHSSALPASAKIRFWSVAAATTVLTVALKLLLASGSNYVGMLVVSAISGALLGIVIASLLHKLTNRPPAGRV